MTAPAAAPRRAPVERSASALLARSLRRGRAALPLLLLILALIVRLDFLFNHPQLEATLGDQQTYLEAARLLAAGLRHLADPAAALADADLAAVQSGRWTLAFWEATTKQGIWPLIMAPAYRLPDPLRALQAGQALAFATLPLAVYLLLRRFAGAGWAALAGLLAALYPPLIIAGGRFLQQAPAGLLLTWALVCLVYMDRARGGRWLLLAGMALLTLTGYLLLVVRPLIVLLLVFLPAGPDRRRQAVKWGWLAALLALNLLWSVFTSGALHRLAGAEPVFTASAPEKFIESALGLSAANLGTEAPFNFGNFLESDMWFAEVHGKREDLGLPPLERRGLADILLAEPLQAFGGLLTNAYRLFLQPFNDYAQPYLLDYGGQAALHTVLMLSAVLGALVSIASPAGGRGRFAWIVLLLAGALLLIYAIIHVESRYRSPLDGAMIALAALAWHWLWKAARAQRWWLLGSLAALWLFNAALDIPTLLLVFPAMSPLLAHLLDVFVDGASWLLTALIIARVAQPYVPVMLRLPGRPTRAVRWLAPALTVAFGLFVALVVVGARLWDQHWRGWSHTLQPGERVAQTISLQGFTPPPGTIPVFLIDAASPAQETALSIRINGVEVKPPGMDLYGWAASPRADGIVAQGTTDEGRYERILSYSQGFVQDFGRYGFMSPDPALWAGADAVEIEVIAAGEGPVTLYGDYAENPALFGGPSLSVWGDGRSYFRFLWDKQDRRLPAFHDLQGLAEDYQARQGAGLGETAGWVGGDLSAAAGRQTGRYRIFMLWLPPEEIIPYVTFPWPPLPAS